MATLIHGVVEDMLHQNDLAEARLPEVVELAVIATGLGMPRSSVLLVGKAATFWDSTQWNIAPRPFLDTQSLAYAVALAGWTREANKPDWASDLLGELKRPMQGSLKYLLKTNDSFYQPAKKQSLCNQSEPQWWELAASPFVSSQVIALRHVSSSSKLSDRHETLVLEKLRSPNRAIRLNAIEAVERMSGQCPEVASEAIVAELKLSSDHRDDEVRAKAMCTVTRLGKLDDITLEVATHLLESPARHVVFAGVYALSTLETVPEATLKLANRNLLRALQACDYEFVELFAKAFTRWVDDPRAHMEQLLQDSPEYLPVALDALQKEPPVVSIA